MPFNYPVTEIYSTTGERACVFSAEEHAARLAEGWLEERPAQPASELYFDVHPLTVPEFELMKAEDAGDKSMVWSDTRPRRKKK